MIWCELITSFQKTYTIKTLTTAFDVVIWFVKISSETAMGYIYSWNIYKYSSFFSNSYSSWALLLEGSLSCDLAVDSQGLYMNEKM